MGWGAMECGEISGHPCRYSKEIAIYHLIYTVVMVSLRTKPFHLVKNSQIGQFQMRFTQQPLIQISCGFFHSTANCYRFNKMLLNCPILIQNMSKNNAEHNTVFKQIGVTFGFISLELLALFE